MVILPTGGIVRVDHITGIGSITLDGKTNTDDVYFVDDFTRMMWVEFLKEKYKDFEKFKIFKKRVEN